MQFVVNLILASMEVLAKTRVLTLLDVNVPAAMKVDAVKCCQTPALTMPVSMGCVSPLSKLTAVSVMRGMQE